MSDYEPGPPIKLYPGAGKTFDDALEDAAANAIAEDRDNDGRRFVVAYHVVRIANPRIREHSIALTPNS